MFIILAIFMNAPVSCWQLLPRITPSCCQMLLHAHETENTFSTFLLTAANRNRLAPVKKQLAATRIGILCATSTKQPDLHSPSVTGWRTMMGRG